ncbi:hypothetical protein W97_04431 [Coniosporium apollinis CBS 100218]|uniref:Piwi domain-containing protein n=1 Tax=Coniosporium apollinis (strain CBS 100218) TaxID=1168221 RepID=R7YTQ9_CONA1|nr:uncharacterized protein W97_04431 [Coniosporium apollinis CBS 100218]EON65194.1 hypothetical protein W97_04431 [Coniosporium apollinis CBS 100218]
MSAPGKKHVQREKKAGTSGSSEEKSSSSGGPTIRDSPARAIAGFDGNRDPADLNVPYSAGVQVDVRRLADGIGFGGWSATRGFNLPQNLPPRPARPNQQGRAVKIGLNTFPVVQMPTKPVYQHDVNIGNGAEKRGLIKRVWNSKAVKSALGPGWIFDGNRIAWSQEKKSLNIDVNLDEETGRGSRGRNVHKITIRFTNAVRFDSLQGYLAGRAPFDNPCLEAISFLDHLMRQTPSQTYTQIKKSFFARGNQRTLLGNGVEAFKGVFSSIRVVLGAEGKPGLSVNVDVANGTFYTESKLHDAVVNFCNKRDLADFAAEFARQRRENRWRGGPLQTSLKRLLKVGVRVEYRNQKGGPQDFIISRFVDKTPSEAKFKIEERDENGDVTSSRETNVLEYYRNKYEVILNNNLPVVEMTKKVRGNPTIIPMELCTLHGNQRYPFKLDERQTSGMIKFAVTLPQDRWSAIEHGLNMLNWENDPFLRNYGMNISKKMTVSNARLLPAPDVHFDKSSVKSAMASSGQWRLGPPQVRFAQPNKKPLKSWGICFINAGRGLAVDKTTAETFSSKLVEIYKAHGGQIAAPPTLFVGNWNEGSKMLQTFWNTVGNKVQAEPQIFFFIIPDRDSSRYLALKKTCETQFGIVSQVMQAAHVQKCQPQYISNVLMKVNAKLGGVTARAVGTLAKLNPKFLDQKNMIIGADVSHAAPGSPAGSMAAFTVSMDKTLTRYAGLCDTNGHRVEIISTANVESLLGELFGPWMREVGGGEMPQRIIYMRDGVSEGQYQHVLDNEVRDIKALCKRFNPKADPKFVVVVASKRHHIRFFPQEPSAKDQNGNPKPGTLVESGVTHPFEFDYYLCPHKAIKGTARPVHYHVILNEANIGAEELQQMTFEHSFQYIRSTTSVSLHPAVYYAHLASNRARAHEQKPIVSDGKGKGKLEKSSEADTIKTPTEIPPLTKMYPNRGIMTSMWYI